MGDRRRGHIFADWIRKQFPPHRFLKIADIAGGTGELSFWLTSLGYNPTVFDRKRKRCKAEFVKGDVKDLHFHPGQFDVVAALHPDGATWHAIRLAAEANCPFVIVPCCVMPPEGKKLGADWLPWLEAEAHKFGFETWRGALDMRGKNVFIKGWEGKR